MTGLRLDGFALRHDGQPMLRDVSLHVREGESLCLIGASGSGKSLIASAIAGLLPDCMAASGSITLHDRTVAAADQTGLAALWHSHLCLLPQEPTSALAPLLRALDQLRLAPPHLPRTDALAWLARYGLDRDAVRRMPHELSGGMAQRLLAALAMRTGSCVLVADEPTKGLDPERRDELIELLRHLRDAGRAMLVITHDMEVVRALGGQVAVLEHGTIVEHGSATDVLYRPRSAYARACLAADPAQWATQPRAPAGATIASANALVIGHGRRRLAGPLGLALAEGSVTGLLGPSGSGKTTLGDTLLGLLRPAAGQIQWLGQGLTRRTIQTHRARFQKLHQDPTVVFTPHRRVRDSLADLARLPGGNDALRRLPALLDRLGLHPDLAHRRPADLSGGEVQRFALARVLLTRPALLVADEPSSRLDPPVQAAALRLLRTLAEEDGLAILLITHDQRINDALADATLRLGTSAEMV
ncbi:ABC transporter ATP-binding protein [Acidisphaera sp. L21]|uniref:ABC transporter ATP-binding protein n=1 Tax=Acidisphaera sp. L21 TaxID=1641851 RepID=UPI00131DD6CB|nr:ATP-binding cassette domain-containing protein [Acidisphaera sp. L21]